MNSISEIGLPASYRLREVVALEHPGHRRRGGEAQDIFHVHAARATRSCAGSRARSMSSSMAELHEQTLGVAVDLLLRQARARLGLARGITDASGEVADDQDRGVSGVLELPELAQDDGPAEGHRRGGGVEPELDAQRTAFDPCASSLSSRPPSGTISAAPDVRIGSASAAIGKRMLPVRTRAPGYTGAMRQVRGPLAMFAVLHVRSPLRAACPTSTTQRAAARQTPSCTRPTVP